MDKRQCASGQTLVELALVLPCFCLGVFMAVQFITYCHNMVELQRIAQVTIDRHYYERQRFNSLWGRFTDLTPPVSSDISRPWRRFRGVSTIKEAGQWLQAQVDIDLRPGYGFSRVLDTVSQHARAETYLEPPIPLEK